MLIKSLLIVSFRCTMPNPAKRTLGFLLHDVARLMRKRYDQRVRHLGLTRAQWQVLAYLSHYEGIQQNGLANILEVEPITLGRIVDKLEASGLVERRRRQGDRRAWLLYLTDQAAPILEDMRTIGLNTQEEILVGIVPDERERLIALLGIMRDNLIGDCSKADPESSLTSHR